MTVMCVLRKPHTRHPERKAQTMTKTTNLTIGQAVTNFGQEATIVSFHSETGDPILQDAEGTRWIADAGKCKPLTDGFRHRDGFLTVG